MTRVLLVGGADDGTTIEIEGDVYSERLIEGYSEVMIFGLPDPGHAWSSGELANVPVTLAQGQGLKTVQESVGEGGHPIVPEATRDAVFAAFAKWVAAQ